MSDNINIVILAAGKGTRLKQDIAKPLCTALGQSLVDYIIQELRLFVKNEKLNANYNIVIGHQKEKVQSHIEEKFSDLNAEFTWQKEQLGTGHALHSFFKENEAAWKNELTLVVCADTPLLTQETFKDLYLSSKDQNVQAVCATFETLDPTGYGRIERGKVGFRIIEEKDASPEQRTINEVNSALYIFKTNHIKEGINNIDQNNKAGEFYLTDLLKIGDHVVAKKFKDETLFLGVNDLAQLAEVEELLLKKKIYNLQMQGVRFLKPTTSYLDYNITIGSESIIGPNVSITGKTQIASECVVEAGTVIKNSLIQSFTTIKANSYLENAIVGKHNAIGPMARLREGTELGDHCKLGNFVETKKSKFNDGAKASHLSYIGDAEIGENTNLGCGFITCNYDGVEKHKTTIGKNSFIGSDSQMVAPIEIGDDCFVASGSTINQNMPDGSFAIARQKQVTKKDYAKRFIKSK